jgi:predicted nucleotide-binding protein
MLTKQLEAGRGLSQPGHRLDESAYSSWETQTRHWVEQSFGERSEKAQSFSMAGFNFVVNSDTDFAAVQYQSLTSKLTKLEAFVALLKQTYELEFEGATAMPSARAGRAASNQVFVVHGHDEGAKEALARFLSKLDLEPVILHEQPSRGLTIIEKLLANAEVGFAVVLLTPDDRGGSEGAAYEEQHPRARQNVILELGYFVGKLGRERVCALYKEGTEIPSDFQGVVFVPMDAAGAWRLTLARELRQVFPHVDMNKAI